MSIIWIYPITKQGCWIQARKPGSLYLGLVARGGTKDPGCEVDTDMHSDMLINTVWACGRDFVIARVRFWLEDNGHV